MDAFINNFRNSEAVLLFVRSAAGLFGGLLVVFLVTYLMMSIRDIRAVLRHYNLPRALLCRWDTCGFYHIDALTDPESKACLSPYVSRRCFVKRSRGGLQLGCRYSIRVREQETERRPAVEYLAEYLQMVASLRVALVSWPLIMLLLGMMLILLGLIEIKDLF